MSEEKINLIIEDFEDKTSTAGKAYTRFKTDQGWMSAFDSKTIGPLKESKGKNVSVTIGTSADGKFKNIRNFHEEAGGSQTVIQTIKPAMSRNPSTTMYVSYAKDLFIALDKETAGSIKTQMDVAIGLVKQARTAFE